MISTSEIKISVLVAREQAALALRTVHRAFQLDQEPPGVGTHEARAAEAAKPRDAVAVVRRLGMEDLTIDDIALDESQARVTISGVPDAPGVAAQIFEEIAAAGILVDMIVQSFGREGRANVSFTVPRTALARAGEVTKGLAQKLGCGPISACPEVAKLSVSGIGMRSHTGVAIGMFESLAKAGINVEMINTSEVRVNVVVAGEKGKAALECLNRTFAHAMA
jgi:aspartate kinase